MAYPMHTLCRLPILLLLAVALGCTDRTGPRVRHPANLERADGHEQQAVAGSVLADSLVVRVTDVRGRAVSDVTVTWSTSDGSVSPGTSTTDAAGRAKTAWTIATSAGENTASASVSGLSPVSFTATGTAGPPAELAKVSGEPQDGVVGSPLADPLAVRVTDVHGNPVGSASVAWAVSSGGGSITPATSTTNAAGEASAAWTLGTAAGDNLATATVQGLPVQTFSARGVPDAPATFEKLGGDGQMAKTGNSLPDPLVVKVTDRYGNVVGNTAVLWEVTRGGGQISPPASTTDAAGQASAHWQLGDTIGTQAAAARVNATSLRADFTATGDPIDPPRAAAVEIPFGATVGKPHFPIGNSPHGGQGETIGGVSCIAGTIAYHIHPHLSLFVNGEQIAIPAAVGVVDPVFLEIGDGYVNGGSCFYWIHTHDATGILHVEPPTQDLLTLGQFFDIWGHPLERENVAGFQGPVTVYVDGVRYRGDPRLIELTEKKHIALYVGTPLAPIPLYIY